jgi:hypothetical protein
MSDLFWQSLGANLFSIATVFVGGVWAWAKISSRSKANTHIAKEARDEAAALRKEFHDFKLQVAKEYASLQLIEGFRDQIMTEFHALRDRVDRVLDRQNGKGG